MEKAPFLIRALEAHELAPVVAELEREGARLDTSGGLVSVPELLAGAVVFEASLDGAPVLHYALAVRAYERASEGVILAAVGRAPGRDMTAELLPLIERQFHNVAAITTYTARPGLVAKLERQGYGRAGWIMRKHIVRGGRA